MSKPKDWRIREPEWKDGEVRYLVVLPLSRPRTKPPKPIKMALTLDGLKEFRTRLDAVIADAEQHPQEVAKRGDVQKDAPSKIPPELIRPGLTWGRLSEGLVAYGATKADLRDVPSEIDGRPVFKRITGAIRPARAG